MANDNEIDVKVKATTDQLGPGMVKAAADVKSSTEQMTAAFATMSENIKSSMTSATEALRHNLEKTHEQLEGFAKGLDTIRRGFALLAEVAAAGWIGDKIFELAEHSAEYADQIERAAQKTGITTEAIQELGFAARMSDVSFESLTTAMTRLAVKMQEAKSGTGATAAAFEAVGISARELKTIKIDDVLMRVAETFHDSEDGAGKAAVAVALFGRAGAELIPLLNKGAAGIDQLREKAHELGLTMGGDGVKGGAQLDDQLKELRASVEGLHNRIGLALAPAFLSASKAVTKFAADANGANGAVVGLGQIMTAFANAMSYVAEMFEATGVTIGGDLATIQILLTQGVTAAREQMKLLDKDLEAISKRYDQFRENLTKPVEAAAQAESAEHKPTHQINFNPGGAQSKAQMYENELAQQKLAFAQQQEAAGTFYQFSLAQERDFWAAKLKLQDLSKEDRLAVEKKYLEASLQIRKQDFEAHIANLRTQIAASKNHWDDQIALAKKAADDIAQAYGKSSKEYEAAAREVIKIEQEKAAQLLAINQEHLREVQAQQTDAIAMDQEMAQEAYDRGLITKAQLLQREIQFEDQRWQIVKAAYDARIELLANEPMELEKARNQELAAERKHQLDMQKLQGKLNVEQDSPWTKTFATMKNSFGTALDAMLQKTTTFRAAIGKMFLAIANTFQTEMIVKPIQKWVANHAHMLAVSLGFMQAETALKTQGAAQGAEVTAAGATAEVSSKAASAAAGAASAMANIPYVGPILAVAAAAAMLAMVAGFKGGIKSASGGYDIPSGVNPVTQLHQEEMVLPAKYANAIRSMAGGGQGGASTTPVFAPNIAVQATDQRSFQRSLARGGALSKELTRLARNFTRPK